MDIPYTRCVRQKHEEQRKSREVTREWSKKEIEALKRIKICQMVRRRPFWRLIDIAYKISYIGEVPKSH